MYPAWCRPLEDILHHHGVDLSKGLTDEQVVEKREKYGFNELEKQKGKPLWLLVLEQFDDMLVKVSQHTRTLIFCMNEVVYPSCS